jgi:hypothetical protein
MSFFVVKSMTNTFSVSELNSGTNLASTLLKSDTPLIVAGIDGHFSSDWECRLYHLVHSVLQNSLLDDSVAIGSVVLLSLLGDLHAKGQFVDGERSKLNLLPFPHEKYESYFMGAFMLAYRLLSRNKPVKDGYWEQVSGELASEDVSIVECNFRTLLEANINYYTPPLISPHDPAYYAEDLTVPSNAFIARLRYLRTKSSMYSLIRMLMVSRGEEALNVYTGGKQELPTLHFPPCADQMIEKMVLFAKTRKRVPYLRRAKNMEIHAYLETKRLEKSRGIIGLGLIFIN